MRDRPRSLLQRLLLLSGGMLWSIQASALQPDLSGLSSVPLHTASPSVVAKALQQVDSKSRPVQFAVHAELPLSLDQGLWDEPEDQPGSGIARWRTRVASPGALGLALSFNRFHLPEGAELWIYDDAGHLVQGPYTHADENSENALWTAVVPGAAAVVELRTPAAKRDEVDLQIDRLSHAFIDISKADALVPAKSESCNVDVVCSDGDAWRRQIRSVALITIDGVALCSGELLNNQRRNRDPLFITANHCEIDTPQIAASLVFYWNFQTAVCSGTPSGSLSQSQSGASLLAGNVSSDFSLLRLTRTPNSAFDVFYSGWDASGAIPLSGVAIHHPDGDEKRISTYLNPAVNESICLEEQVQGCARRVDTWKVNWTRGSTSEGSSGGGLWNQEGRLVGVLSGGLASCTRPFANDYFARLAAGFTAAPAKNAQLKAWLDPCNTGTRVMDGLDSKSTEKSEGSCSSGGGGAMPLGMLVVFAVVAVVRRRFPV